MIKTRKEIAEEAINKYLNEPIKNITQAYYDEFVKENAESSAQVGLKTIVSRREIGRCCDWCHSLVGEYEYGEQPADFFRRHDYCKCIVLFRNEKGRYTDVWSKKEYSSEKDARIEKAKELESEDAFNKMSRETLKKYWDSATPGRGEIKTEAGWEKGQNGDAEIKYAKILHDKFGGDVTLLKKRKRIFPDYLWNGRLWEHKSVQSANSIDKQVQKGIHQIETNPGGLIIEVRKKQPKTEIYKIIMNRLVRSTPSDVKNIDVFVFENDEMLMAINYIKKR